MGKDRVDTNSMTRATGIFLRFDKRYLKPFFTRQSPIPLLPEDSSESSLSSNDFVDLGSM